MILFEADSTLRSVRGDNGALTDSLNLEPSDTILQPMPNANAIDVSVLVAESCLTNLDAKQDTLLILVLMSIASL